MSSPATETVEKQEIEYAPEHKISMSAEEKTAEEIAVSAPVLQVEKLQEQQVIVPSPIVDDEEDDEEEIVQKKSAPKVEAVRKPKVEKKPKINRSRFDKPVGNVNYGSGMDNDGYGR